MGGRMAGGHVTIMLSPDDHNYYITYCVYICVCYACVECA